MAKKTDPQRLRQMDLLLRWEGRIGNARLRGLLGLSSIRASQWIREFRESQPRWTLWNRLTRCFDATPEFYRTAILDNTQSLAEYLSLVGLPSAMNTNIENVVVAAFPDISAPNAQIFATLSNACRLITYSDLVLIRVHSENQLVERNQSINPGSPTVEYISNNFFLKVFESEDVDMIKKLEVDLIKKYEPEFNSSHRSRES